MKRGVMLIVFLMLSIASISVLAANETRNAADVIFGKTVGDIETTVAPTELSPDEWSFSQNNPFRNPFYYVALLLALAFLLYSLSKKRKATELSQEEHDLDIKRTAKCEGCGQEYSMLEKACPYCSKDNKTLKEEEIVEETAHTEAKPVTLEAVDKAGFLALAVQVRQKYSMKIVQAFKTDKQENKEDDIVQIEYKMKKCKKCTFDLFLDDRVCPVCGRQQ